MTEAEADINLVELWLRRDPKRWVAGVLAGLFAGAVALGLAVIFSGVSGGDAWFPAKLLATIPTDAFATETANSSSIVVGIVVWELIAAFWGFVYAHFTQTNALAALLGVGVVWALFSWVFIWNLFLQAFRPILAAHVGSGPVFPIMIAYGVALTSVAFFDRALRGGRA